MALQLLLLAVAAVGGGHAPASAAAPPPAGVAAHLPGRFVVLGPQLVAATLHVTRTVAATHLSIVFQGDTDPGLLEGLWEGGVGVLLLEEGRWWGRLQRLSYKDVSQHVLVGDLGWVADIMRKVKHLYASNAISAAKTHWIWVCPNAPGEPDAAEDPTDPASAPRASSRAREVLAGHLQEGVRGVLVAQVTQGRDPEEARPGDDGGSVDVSGVETLWDGRSRLKRSAVWASGRLRVFSPLWPGPTWDLRGRLVRLTCHNKPTVFSTTSGSGLASAEGYLAELLQEVERRLNFSSSVAVTEGFGSLTQDGSWNGMVGVIAQGEADVAPLDFTPSVERMEVVDFSRPLGQDVVVIMAKAPAVLVRPFLLLQIYSPQMWGCVVGGAALVGLVMARLSALEAEMSFVGRPKGGRACDLLVSTLGILVYQSSHKWPTGGAGRMLASLLMVMALVVGSLYCSSITAFLAIPFRSEPIDSLEDLVASGVVPVVRSKVTVYNFILRQKGGLLGEIRERMEALSGSQIGSWEFMKKVAGGTHALVDTYSGAVGRARVFERRGSTCLFHLARKHVKVDLDTMAYARNSFVAEQFDEIIRWFAYYGIIEQLKRPYYSIPCRDDLRSDHPQAMTLQQTQGAFYVLAVGLTVSAIALVAETAWALCQRMKADAGRHHLTR